MVHARVGVAAAVAFLAAGCSSAVSPCSRSRPGAPACCPTGPADPYRAVAAIHGRGGGAVWSFLSRSYDADRDGKVSAAEYPREPKRFAGLDRDHDGDLTPADFAGPTRMDLYVSALVLERLVAALDPDAASAAQSAPEADEAPPDAESLARAFAAADADRSGRVGEPELVRALAQAQRTPIDGVLDLPAGVRPFPSLAAAMDADRSGDLASDEVQAFRLRWEDLRKEEADARARAKAKAEAKTAPDGEPKPPPRPKPPEVGEMAPDFTLRTWDGRRTLTLSSLRGQAPVALVFGSYTCPPFRHAATWIREAHRAHGRQVRFLFVYVREAHAIDGPAPIPAPDQPVVEEPRTLDERLRVANACLRDLGFDVFETLVDDLDDAVAKAYEAPPARLYVVGRDGRVAYRSGRGPFGLIGPEFADAVRAASGRAPGP